MNVSRKDFIGGLAAFGALGGCQTTGGSQNEYSISILGDTHFDAAGHYLLRVSDRGVAVDFYACDALTPTETFVLR